MKDTLLSLVESGAVELVNSKEVEGLRDAAKKAIIELENYKRRLSNTGDIVFECNCESALPSCTYIHSVEPNRDPKRPNFCPLDGNGCKWKKITQ